MDSSYIIPFIKSVKNVFETMLQLPVQVGKPSLKAASDNRTYDVSGIIGLSGDIEGAVTICFPKGTGEKIISKFICSQVTIDHEDFADAIGELINMITGSAKAMLEGKNISISCPSVVLGSGHVVVNPSDIIRLALPCQSELGEFEVEVSLKKSCLSASGDSQPQSNEAA